MSLAKVKQDKMTKSSLEKNKMIMLKLNLKVVMLDKNLRWKDFIIVVESKVTLLCKTRDFINEKT